MKNERKIMSRSNLYIQGETISLEGLSKLLGKTTTYIKQLIDKGLPFEMDGNMYLFDTAIATRWVITYEVSQSVPDDVGKIAIDEARRRYEVARALQAELALAKEREQVANIDDLMTNFTAALVQVRAKLVGMPSRLSGILSHQDEKVVAELLEKDITETLEILSDYKHEYTGNEQSSEAGNSNKNNSSSSKLPIPTP